MIVIISKKNKIWSSVVGIYKERNEGGGEKSKSKDQKFLKFDPPFFRN